MSELGFDLESQLQGTDPEIEVDCEFLIPSGGKKDKSLKCVAIFERADSDERKELNKEIREKEAYQYELEKKAAEYQGMISNLSAGKVVDKEIDLPSVTAEIISQTEELVDWFKNMIESRLKGLKGFELKNGKKVDITVDQLPEVLPELFKWDHYIQGLAAAFRLSLSSHGVEQARLKN